MLIQINEIVLSCVFIVHVNSNQKHPDLAMALSTLDFEDIIATPTHDVSEGLKEVHCSCVSDSESLKCCSRHCSAWPWFWIKKSRAVAFFSELLLSVKRSKTWKGGGPHNIWLVLRIHLNSSKTRHSNQGSRMSPNGICPWKASEGPWEEHPLPSLRKGKFSLLKKMDQLVHQLVAVEVQSEA